MSKDGERVEARNVTMYPKQWKIVDELDDLFQLGTGAALRTIVTQWHEMRAIQNRTWLVEQAKPVEVGA